ncbi:MAG: TerC family protein, partial [Alphaproteobacteria bacterium]|nr:TerC family protein [Alphaproteobacteria bacterium]
TITLANTVMSLDNSIAMAAAAKGDMTLISIGLVISVPVIMLGATIIASVLDRFPWVGMIGAGLIGWIAGDVIADDALVKSWLEGTFADLELVLSALGAGLVLVVGLYLSRRARNSEA